jgi:ADP-ribose pyrophosphatase YjhB (NUDIX family)
MVSDARCYHVTMFKNGIGEYVEPGYKGHPVFLDEEVYAKVLDSVVVACVDILVTCEDEVVIARRTRHPQASWWLFGGRMIAGESIFVTARRVMQNECGLDIPTDRLVPLTTFVAAWNKRAHEPEDNGTHTLSVVLRVEITRDEYANIVTNDEYSEIKLVKPDKATKDQVLHPALQQCIKALESNEEHKAS